MSNMLDMLRLAEAPIRTFEDLIRRAGLTGEAGLAAADHIGWKCGSNNEFGRLRRLFEANSRYIYQSFISGRRIAIVRLTQGIPTSLGVMHFVELSDQKPDGSQKSGFDHIEIYPLWGVDATAALVEHIVAHGPVCTKVMRPHHMTHDFVTPLLDDPTRSFTVRIEDGPLIDKIRNEEMR